MWIFFSIIFVSVSLKIASKCYTKMYSEIRLIFTQMVLIPFRFSII